MAIRFKPKLIIKNETLTGLSPLAGRSLEDALNSYKCIDEIICSLTDYFVRISTPEKVHPEGTGRPFQMISFPDGQAICQIAVHSTDHNHPIYEFLVHRNGENFFYKYIFNCELKESLSTSN